MSEIKNNKCKATLKGDSIDKELSFGQSPRGIRDKSRRPDTIVIDCQMTADKNKLETLIAWLHTLSLAME